MGVYNIVIVNDIEIGIKAENIVELFDTIAKVFCELTLEETPEGEMEKEIRLNCDLPDAAVDFFNELIYLFETEGFSPRSIVDFKRDKGIYIKIAGSIRDFKKNKIKRLLKAATYHNLEFKNKNGYFVKMLIDI